MNLPGAPSHDRAVLEPDLQAAVVVDARCEPFHAGVAPDTPSPKPVRRFEARANQPQSAGRYRMKVSVERFEGVGEERCSVRRSPSRDERHRRR